ncbi:MAG: DUF3014 domain-containing protein [bacterium]
MRTGFILAGIGVALVVILAIQFWPQTDESAQDKPTAADTVESVTEDPQAQTPVADVPAAATDSREDERVEVPVLPPLGESDVWVRERLSEWPLPADWLARDDLIARLSVVLHNTSQGRLPRRQLSFLAPSKVYPVVQEGELLFADPSGYARYTPYLDLLEKLPPARAAQLIEQMEPLLLQAFALLGERTSVQSVLRATAAQIAALPELNGPVRLVQPNVMYLYADPALEGRSELDKQLLRMGPENVRRLKAYVAEFMAFYSPQTD